MNTNDLKNKPDEALFFIARDCLSAVSAMPENPKAREYLDTADACRDLLRQRSNLRILREALLYAPDPLTIDVRYRRHLSVSEYHITRRNHARVHLGLCRLKGYTP